MSYLLDREMYDTLREDIKAFNKILKGCIKLK